MQYQINDYLFNDETLMLFKDGDVLRFRANEAKLLVFFLKNSDKVVSKEVILDEVWAGKVVSEQVVFQNISHLRSLFGNSAIKTYSKKGYQWQLAFKETFDAAPTHPPVNSSNETGQRLSYAKQNKIKFGLSRWLFGGLVLGTVLVLFSVLFFKKAQDTEHQAAPSVSVLPISIATESKNGNKNQLSKKAYSAIWQPIIDQGNYHVVSHPADNGYADIFSVPRKYYQDITEAEQSDYVLAMSVGNRDSIYFVRYMLIGKQSFWHEELEAVSTERLNEKLTSHLNQVVQSKVLDIEVSDHIKITEKLTALYKKSPDDLIVLYRLIRNHSENGEPNKALLLAEELLSKSLNINNKTSEAIAYLQQALSYIQLKQISKAQTLLEKAKLIFIDQGNYHSLVAVDHAYVGIAFTNNFNYQEIKAAYLSAIDNSRKAQNPIQEFKDTIILSHIAGNLHYKDDQQLYLRQAKHVLIQSQMPREYFAIYFLYAGKHADDSVLAEQHFRRTLDILPEGHAWPEREEAREALVKLFITQQRFPDAVVLFEHISGKTPAQELSLASIYAASQYWLKAEEQGLLAFKASSLNNQYRIALNSALLLAEIYHQQNNLENRFYYIEFIKNNHKAEPFWASYNAERLSKLGIELERQNEQ